MRLLYKAFCKGGVRDSLVILSSIVKACVAPKVCDSSGKLPANGIGLMKKEKKLEMKKEMKEGNEDEGEDEGDVQGLYDCEIQWCPQ